MFTTYGGTPVFEPVSADARSASVTPVSQGVPDVEGAPGAAMLYPRRATTRRSSHTNSLGGISTPIDVTYYDHGMDALAFDEVVSGGTGCFGDTAWPPEADDPVPSEER